MENRETRKKSVKTRIKNHGIRKIKRACLECGKEYTVYLYRKNTTFFCSKICHDKFRKGKPSSLKGKRHSKETRSKMSFGKIGMEKLAKERLNDLYWDQNKSSIEIGKMFNISKTTVLNWLKEHGIRRKTLSEARVGKYTGKNSPSWKGKIEKNCLGCGKSFYVYHCNNHLRFCSKTCWYSHGYSEKSKLKMSKSQLKILQSPEKREEYLRRILDKINIRPNKSELLLDNILQTNFPNQWKYTGDFSVVIGGKSPDWTNINGQKEVILLHGIYWHLWKLQKQNPSLTKADVEKADVKHYENFGFKCHIFWDRDIMSENGEQIVLKELNIG